VVSKRVEAPVQGEAGDLVVDARGVDAGVGTAECGVDAPERVLAHEPDAAGPVPAGTLEPEVEKRSDLVLQGFLEVSSSGFRLFLPTIRRTRTPAPTRTATVVHPPGIRRLGGAGSGEGSEAGGIPPSG